MNLYIEAMGKEEAYLFKQLKREFKHNKPCAHCAKQYSPKKMTVDHIKRVADGARLVDYDNWQVLCIPCHSIKNKEETKGLV